MAVRLVRAVDCGHGRIREELAEPKFAVRTLVRKPTASGLLAPPGSGSIRVGRPGDGGEHCLRTTVRRVEVAGVGLKEFS